MRRSLETRARANNKFKEAMTENMFISGGGGGGDDATKKRIT